MKNCFDRLVYALYSLTPEEIKLVERAGRGMPVDDFNGYDDRNTLVV